MDEFGCDYECRTVGEGIIKYNIPDDWCVSFDVYDVGYPIIYIGADQIRRNSAIMELKLRVVENQDEEYAGCIVLSDSKTIIFKIDHINDLMMAMEV